MKRFILVNGVLKGSIICIFTQFLFSISQLLSMFLTYNDKAGLIKIPIVIPIITVFIGYFMDKQITIKNGVFLSVIWLIIFLSFEIFKVIGLKYYLTTDLYSVLIMISITLTPLIMALSNYLKNLVSQRV